jgi:hypothetical protein
MAKSWAMGSLPSANHTSTYSNPIHGSASDEHEFHEISLEQAAAARPRASDSHNREETANFARSSEGRAPQAA